MLRYFSLSILLILIGLTGRLYSQASDYGNDSLRCLGSLSVMSEFAKLELYDEAYDAWKYAFSHCPAASRNIYIIGANIVKHRIENLPDQASREQAIDTLILLYDRRMELFGQKGYVLGRKALDLMAYRPAQTETIYAMLKESVALEKEAAEAAVLGNLLQASSVMFRKNAISASTVIGDYDNVMHYFSGHPSLSMEQRTRAMESLNEILVGSGSVTCESLQDHFLPVLDKYKNDPDYLKNLVSLMSNMGCMGSDLYLKVSTYLFDADPSAEMALYLAAAFLEAGEPAEANELYEEALQMETDPSKRAGIYCRMSMVSHTMGEFLAAREAAQKALEINPDMGEAYLAIGIAYAGSAESCGENGFEKQAVFWAAVDQFTRAAAADPSVREDAEALILKYSPYFPDNETAFFYGYSDGDAYHVDCWINEDTIVRTQRIAN